MVNRKLFRPVLTDVKEQQFTPRPAQAAATAVRTCSPKEACSP